MNTSSPIILGSSSQQRKELIQQLFPNRKVSVIPPQCSDELDLSHLTDQQEIAHGLQQIARDKNVDVSSQLSETSKGSHFVLTADTGIVVSNQTNQFQILGKPCEENYREIVRSWFEQYYLGKTHEVMTAVCLSIADQRFESLVTSQVTMSKSLHDRIGWYLDTKEPLGKAGGYAIQGAGSLFVEQVTGSISNIIGLPLKETFDLFDQAQK